MIPIVAKDYEAFQAICFYFKIEEKKAKFVRIKEAIEKNIHDGSKKYLNQPIYESNVIRDGSDWLCYDLH